MLHGIQVARHCRATWMPSRLRRLLLCALQPPARASLDARVAAADHRANLCLEQIDVDLLVEQAVIPERHLQDTLSEFGIIEKFTFFSVIGVVAVKFSSVEQAVLVSCPQPRSQGITYQV